MGRYRPRFVSAIALYEVYKLFLEREGKETAETRTARIRKVFGVVPVNDSIAIRGAYRESSKQRGRAYGRQTDRRDEYRKQNDAHYGPTALVRLLI